MPSMQCDFLKAENFLKCVFCENKCWKCEKCRKLYVEDVNVKNDIFQRIDFSFKMEILKMYIFLKRK